jgi:hypothetical protein
MKKVLIEGYILTNPNNTGRALVNQLENALLSVRTAEQFSFRVVEEIYDEETETETQK